MFHKPALNLTAHMRLRFTPPNLAHFVRQLRMIANRYGIFKGERRRTKEMSKEMKYFQKIC